MTIWVSGHTPTQERHIVAIDHGVTAEVSDAYKYGMNSSMIILEHYEKKKERL
jgi:hypothetical protein